MRQRRNENRTWNALRLASAVSRRGFQLAGRSSRQRLRAGLPDAGGACGGSRVRKTPARGALKAGRIGARVGRPAVWRNVHFTGCPAAFPSLLLGRAKTVPLVRGKRPREVWGALCLTQTWPFFARPTKDSDCAAGRGPSQVLNISTRRRPARESRAPIRPPQGVPVEGPAAAGRPGKASNNPYPCLLHITAHKGRALGVWGAPPGGGDATTLCTMKGQENA